MDPKRPTTKYTNKYKIITLGFLVHVLLLLAVFDVYFSSPLDQGMIPQKSTDHPPAKRLVLIVADGLRAEAIFDKDEDNQVPFLHRMKGTGSWGVAHTRVPTESRPGHVAILAGIYEDPSAILKGWKANPVSFDSVISESVNAWCWGSPDIVNLFNKDNSRSVHLYTYGSEMEDFGKQNTGVLDKWVYDKVEGFLKEVQICNQQDCNNYYSSGNLFFLHLLGIDTAGHGYKPRSKEYVNNIKLVDEIARNVTHLFQSTFRDDSTAFLFTADHGMTDWGSHGSGSSHETEVPIIGWGAGIKRSGRRQDVNQIDIAPLLSSLIGINIPVNSLGILPAGYLDMSDLDLSRVLLSNVLQLLEIFNVKRLRTENNALIYVPYKGLTTSSVQIKLNNLNQLGNKKQFEEHVRECVDFMQLLIDGFFGTGNIASLNSFDPMWVRAFLTVFSPFKMTGLILLKFMVPFIFTCCVFRAINSVGRENVLNTFCIVLVFSDLMVLHFLYLITNVGSCKMRIAIIGAGAAGLAALKHGLDDGHDCIAYEKSGKVGGTWNYSDNVGRDEFGLPIHSSMYQGLRQVTNLPKELMQYENFAYKESKRSILFQEEVLAYINSYANTFNLTSHITFFKHITEVSPLPENKWTVKIKDLKTNVMESKEYDAVMVCVGNYSVPKTPKIQGLEIFKGKIIHSHIYRKPDPFRNRKTLVIGGGPSGVDISRMVAEVADKVYVSLRSGNDSLEKFSEKVTIKPEILRFTENGVGFKDGSEATIDDVILCTGYLYSYPFLSPKCDIQVDNNWVKYLYKQIVNINHQTMAFIGIPFRVTPFPMFGIQVRFFLKFLKGQPVVSKDQMLEELTQYMLKKKEEGQPIHYAHFLGLKQGWYMDDLADTACIKRVPPVIQKLYAHFHSLGNKKFKMSFRLLNDGEFEESDL
ncbi:hypothetical protein NQ315_006772 [Exocentrus adspersus]|uniref:Multifunctional fusion protein n=1 Tax=Exocentrus adspersus TaxID=1586481 RepID=A0AAV8WE98_9CUCU|nr:hypothetical protein NQ315_006772 [Exocentrus adspersus]